MSVIPWLLSSVNSWEDHTGEGYSPKASLLERLLKSNSKRTPHKLVDVYPSISSLAWAPGEIFLGVTLPTFLDRLFAEAPSDHQLHVARVAVHLCAQLADGMQD